MIFVHPLLTFAVTVHLPGTREGGPERDAMHGWFEEEMQLAGVPFIVVEGDEVARLGQATAEIDRRMRFPELPLRTTFTPNERGPRGGWSHSDDGNVPPQSGGLA